MHVPKTWLTDVAIPYGPLEGKLAHVCPCGRPVDLEKGGIWLTQIDEDLWFIHNECMKSIDAQIRGT